MAGLALCGALAVPGAVLASSHRETPNMGDDPAADSTDFYLFRSPPEDPEGADTVTFIANYWPLEEPGGGPNFPRLSEEVLYEIKIDNDGDAKEDITYTIYVNTKYLKGKESFLYNLGPIASPTDPNLLVQQFATVTRTDKKGKTEQKEIPVAPIFVGQASYPAVGGFSSEEVYEKAAMKAVTPLKTRGGGKIFIGPRDDPFYVDLGFIFDLLQIRGGAPGGNGKAGGVDYLAGYNVHTIALQIPIDALTADGAKSPKHGKASVIGAWTNANRARVTTLRPGQRPKTEGWVQVSRLGIPLVNEVLVPVGIKDFYGSTQPRDDVKNAAGLLQDPELAKLFKLLYKLPVPGAGRKDIVNLVSFNLGIAPLDVAGLQPADILRLDLSVPASTLNPKSRLGLLAGDPAGFPNGRRLADDIVDIEERVVAGALCQKGKTCDVDAVSVPLGDGVDQNDRPWQTHFPYVGTPWSGSYGAPLHMKALPHP
jgi:hypothetical protein